MLRGLFGIVLFGLVAIVAGLIGYQWGLTSNAVGAGGTVVVTGGFPGFGFLFFLLFLGFLFFAFAGARRRAWGHGAGPWGSHQGRWSGGTGTGGPTDASDPRRQWIADFHRRLHEEEVPPDAPTNDPPAG